MKRARKQDVMAMLPNDSHPGRGCSCRDCLRKYPDGRENSNGSERPTRTQSNYLKTVRQLADAETDLTRAQNRWQKLRAKKARYEKRLDADFIRRSGGLGGKLDWRELAQDIIEQDGDGGDL